jgi:2-polyprenyl-6-methoxyphenol hydroxylase-like FAD-dependent oxidoreductase
MTGRIAIVGAGPAGLTAAIVARRLGLEAVVYEQAPELTRVGGGIAIQNNGQRVLDAVGLLSGFAARMATADTIAIEGPGGRRYATLDYGALRVPFPCFAVVLPSPSSVSRAGPPRRAATEVSLTAASIA